MNYQEIKAALADEDMAAKIDKIVDKAVKAETKRCMEIVKNTSDEQAKSFTETGERTTGKILKDLGKTMLEEIKAAA